MPYAETGGVRLWYEQRGEGPSVLLVPGLGLTTAAWADVADRLAGFRTVLTVDPRGAGRSDKPDEAYSGEIFAADLAAVLDATGIDRADVVGMSMGGMVGQELGIRHALRVHRLVLLSTYAAPDPWSRRVFQVRRAVLEGLGHEDHVRLAALFVFSPTTFREDPEVVAAYERGALDRPPDRAAYLRQLQYCLDHDTRGRLDRITAPTLAVSGSEDLLTPPELGRELAVRIPGARYREIAGASHGLIWERPDAVAELVLDFAGG